MTKAIVVSPEEYYEFFKEAFTEWDIQHPVLSVQQMWDDLGNELLDENSEIVVLNDVYYNANSEDLEQAIITLAEEALVLVIADDKYKEAIIQKISYIAQRDFMNVSTFWFVSRDNPIGEINEAIIDYQALKASQVENVTNAPEETYPAYPETSSNQVDVTNSAYANNPYLDSDGLVAPAPKPVYSPAHLSYAEGESDTEAYQEKINEVTNYVETFKNASYAGDGYTGPERNGMIVASTSSKGGSGKSTVALCTAAMLYHSSRLSHEMGESPRPLEVIIVDMDTRDGQIGFYLAEQHPTVLNIFTSQDFSRNNIRNNIVYNQRLGIHALLAPKRAKTADYTTPEFYRDIISKLRTMFDIVILDTSVNVTDSLIYDVVLPISDAVLFITDMSRGSVFGMTRWIAEVTLPLDKGGTAAISKDKIGVVVNKSMGNVGFNQNNLVEAAAEVPLIASIPMDSKAVLAATNNDRLDDIVLKHPTLSPAYFSLAQKIVQGSVPIKSPYEALTAEPVNKNTVLPPAKKKKGLFGR